MDWHQEITKELHDIYIEKNKNYGDSFSKTFRTFGLIASVTRIADKFYRLATVANMPLEEQQGLSESVEDTLLDLANYCIMTIHMLELPLSDVV